MKDTKKTLNVYEVIDEDEGFCYFFVARSAGGARYAYCQEIGLLFEEAFGVKFRMVPSLKKYIQGEDYGYQINPWENEYWMRAVYAEGGSFTNGACESDGSDDILTIEEIRDRECRHNDGTKCDGWDEESIWINLPPKKTKQ